MVLLGARGKWSDLQIERTDSKFCLYLHVSLTDSKFCLYLSLTD